MIREWAGPSMMPSASDFDPDVSGSHHMRVLDQCPYAGLYAAGDGGGD